MLFVSPHGADAAAISRMLAPASVEVEHVRGLVEASTLLRRKAYAAILTECRLPDGRWEDVLELARCLPGCAVIVTDRLADDLLWAEVLSAGAYDMLAQPFDADEVRRILQNACLHARAVPANQPRTPIAVNL